MKLGANSSLIDQTLAESGLEDRYGLWVVGILRRGRNGEEHIAAPSGDAEFHGGDILLAIAPPADLQRAIDELGLSAYTPRENERQRVLWEMGAAPVLIHPDSHLIGHSLRELEFRTSHHLQVVGLRRDQQAVPGFEDVPLQSSDRLLVAGSWSEIQALQSHTRDFVVLEMPAEHAERVVSYRKMPTALGILLVMVLLTVFDVVPLVAAVLMAMMAAVFTRCLTMEEAYQAIPLGSIVLIAGMLPLADALRATGGTDLIVESMMAAAGEAAPSVMLTLIFFLTAGLGLVLSNTASAVLVAPIAITAAQALGVSPYPFAVAVLIAASAAYSTPVSTPVVTLVVEPGRYRFMDFVKVGLPMLLLTYVVTLVLAPLVFPYQA